MPPKRRKVVTILAIVMLIVSTLGLVGVSYYVRDQPRTQLVCDSWGLHCNLVVPTGAIDLALNITVTDPQGQRVSSTYLPHDLITNNFYNWLIQFLNNAQSAATTSASLKNTGGGTGTINVWGSTSYGSSGCGAAVGTLNCDLAGGGGLIEIGTGTAAATRADYALTTPFQSFFDTASYCSAGSTDSVIVTGSETAGMGATITEAGLFVQPTISGSANTYMMAHDVFTGIVVSGGNTVTVQYTWALNNAGFNYNFCEYFAALFTQPNGLGNQVKTPAALAVFYNTAGQNVTWYPACQWSSSTYVGALQPSSSVNPSTSACAGWTSGQTNNALQIAIGTGTTAFTPTSRSLTSYYAQNYVTSVSYDSAGNAYETATIPLATGATISEAAIYLTLPNGCINYSPNHGGAGGLCGSYASSTIMLLAVTFTGQAVPNGQSIGITLQESG